MLLYVTLLTTLQSDGKRQDLPAMSIGIKEGEMQQNKLYQNLIL